MLFNSYVFIVFFALILALSRAVRAWTPRKVMLLCASYIFYAAWNPPFVALLLISTLTDWYAARGIHRHQAGTGRRLWLAMSLLVNLGMLAFFKYGSFITENVNALFDTAILPAWPGGPGLLVPVGISFYTFQTLSYTFDVYRGRLQPWASFLDYALYVSFLPQLVAGPIVRAGDFLPQCATPRAARGDQIGWGLSLFVVGLFAKVVIADVLMAPVVDIVFDSGFRVGFFAAWVGSLAFSVQIFCDFFGYSTCAVGLALCLGFSVPDNFRFPYAAAGFRDFWRRWHITLSSWLRDYLYIPLGGNRHGLVRACMNVGITMLIGGLWHGASWGFVVWGGLHGTYLIAELLLTRSPFGRRRFWSTRSGRTVVSLLTFAFVCLAWPFFRAQSVERALMLSAQMLDVCGACSMISDLLTSSSAWTLDALNCAWLGTTQCVLTLLCAAGLVGLHHYLKDSSLEALFGRIPWYARAVVLASMAYLAVISMTGEHRAFIYFQF